MILELYLMVVGLALVTMAFTFVLTVEPGNEYGGHIADSVFCPLVSMILWVVAALYASDLQFLDGLGASHELEFGWFPMQYLFWFFSFFMLLYLLMRGFDLIRIGMRRGR